MSNGYDYAQQTYLAGPIMVDANGVPVVPDPEPTTKPFDDRSGISGGTGGVLYRIQSDNTPVLVAIGSSDTKRSVTMQNTGLYDIWIVGAGSTDRGFKLSAGATQTFVTGSALYALIPYFYNPTNPSVPYVPSSGRLVVVT